MRYIFIVQGDGRGHMTQAITLREMLAKNGHEVVEVLIGKSPQKKIPDFFLRRIETTVNTFDSPNFQTNTENKQSAIYKSAVMTFRYLKKYIKSITYLNERINELKPDVVINFYDLVAGLTYAFYKPEVPMFCIAHQYLFLHPGYKFPKKNKQMVEALKIYTRITCLGASRLLALSFVEKPDIEKKNMYIIPPLLRKELYEFEAKKGDFYLGYMLNSGFASEVTDWHKKHKDLPLRFFWDKKDAKETTVIDDTLQFHQINDQLFLEYMSQCAAYATTGGFESVCEAMYYQKPVMMVPAHIEQECNANEAELLGIGIASNEFNLSRLRDFVPHYQPNDSFKKWLGQSESKMLRLLEDTTMKNNTKYIPGIISSILLRFQRMAIRK